MMLNDLESISSKEDLADFIGKFRAGLSLNPNEWENSDLESFLAAMESWIRVMDVYAVNTGDQDVVTPSWSTFAKILCASKIYE